VNRLGWAFLSLIALVIAALFGLQGTGIADVGARRVPESPAQIAAAAPAKIAMVIPVLGVRRNQLVDTWNQSRESGARVHQAIDIAAPGGTPVIAAFAGRIEKLFVSERGGITIYVRSSAGDWLGYYAHLSGYAAGMREGLVVARGQVIGYVGDTGNAGPGNAHLHFALHRVSAADRWYQGTPVNPYPLLAR